MKPASVWALHPTENRTYKVLWLVCFACWLGTFAVVVLSGRFLPWLPFSLLGAVGAVVFGQAVRHQFQLWPFSRLWPKPSIVGAAPINPSEPWRDAGEA